MKYRLWHCEKCSSILILGYSTKDYVAAAYASIFAANPITEISNRAIGLLELAPTGEEIAAVLMEKHGTEPEIITHTLEKVDKEFEFTAHSNTLFLFSMAWYNRKIWGTGEMTTMLGRDIWEVPGYHKATLEDLILRETVEPYRELPDTVRAYLEDRMF